MVGAYLVGLLLWQECLRLLSHRQTIMALVSTQGCEGAIHRTAPPLQRGVCWFTQATLARVQFEEELGLRRRAPVRPAGCKDQCPVEIVPRKTQIIHF